MFLQSKRTFSMFYNIFTDVICFYENWTLLANQLLITMLS